MIYGLIALALAGSASAQSVSCQVNTEEIACRNFNTATDFKVSSEAGNVYAISHINKFNGAILGVTTDPWNREEDVADMAAAGTHGCTFVSNSNGGVTAAAFPTTTDAHTCTSTGETACTNTASGEAKLTNTVTLQHLVNKLDANGAYGLYYQRVTNNPIQGATLKWISSNACKVTMPVQFACTGSDCIEVQNIVCASFAGITSGNFGQVNIECKVPPSFQVSSAVGAANGNMYIASTTTGASFGWGTDAQACQAGKCTVQVTTDQAIGAAQSITGTITVSAEVQQITGSGAGTWSGQLDTFHTAKYNLTRASATAQTLSMPIGVNFLTAPDSNQLADTAVAGAFTTRYGGVDSVPFLSTQKVELGAIVKPQHGYLRIVAKVQATTHWFSGHAVTSIEKSSDVTTADQGFAAVTTNPCSAIDKANHNSHTANSYPQAFFKCPGVLASVNAGDLIRFALEWKLVRTPSTSASGKAQLLQAAPEVDPNAQSVEVQVTIQLGGGETNITTGTAEGAASADNTVTYIIIAVCVIAAALILAVVVVAFMCLRNRSQEQLVAMSPKQATVAAVYDISAPKKADVMDV